MDRILPKNMELVLKKELKKFKSFLLEDNYEQFKDYDNEGLLSLYLYSLIDNPKALKKVKNICTNGGVDTKEFNEFIYVAMKYVDKNEKGIWSWYEMNELNICHTEVKKTTLTYTIM